MMGERRLGLCLSLSVCLPGLYRTEPDDIMLITSVIIIRVTNARGFPDREEEAAAAAVTATQQRRGAAAATAVADPSAIHSTPGSSWWWWWAPMILLQVHLQQPCYDFCFL